MRRYISPIELNRFTFVASPHVSEVVRKPVFASLLEEFIDMPDGSHAVSLCSDVSLIFNQKRLDSLGADSIKHMIDNLSSGSDGLAKLRASCSDDDFISLVKSRHIQSPCELQAWNDYLDDNYRHELDKLKSRKSKSKVDKPVDKVEPDKTD